MDLIILRETVWYFFAECTLADLSEVYIVVCLITVKDMLKIHSLIGHVESESYYSDQMMELGAFELCSNFAGSTLGSIAHSSYQSQLSCHREMSDRNE